VSLHGRTLYVVMLATQCTISQYAIIQNPCVLTPFNPNLCPAKVEIVCNGIDSTGVHRHCHRCYGIPPTRVTRVFGVARMASIASWRGLVVVMVTATATATSRAEDGT
jgi:hypothetical protein